MTTVPRHYFSVDVEEYFQVSAFEAYVPRSSWESLESRVERSVERALELLEGHGVRATFFVLGWIAARHPGLVRSMAAAGHEVASHGWEHRRVTELAPEEFRESVRRTRSMLEEITGTPVLGYRAPSFSIVRGCEWSLDVLLEEGYRYDSSLFPVRRPGYGYAGGRRWPHRIERRSGALLEVPPATLRLAGMNMPAAGGAYLRLLPLSLVRSALEQAERLGVPATLYIHPWELDPEQPRLPVPALARLRHYGGLHRMERRLTRLFQRFEFGPIAPALEAV